MLSPPCLCQPALNCFQAPPRGQFGFCTVLWQLFSVHLPLGPFKSRERYYHSSPSTLMAALGKCVTEVWATAWLGKVHTQNTMCFQFIHQLWDFKHSISHLDICPQIVQNMCHHLTWKAHRWTLGNTSLMVQKWWNNRFAPFSKSEIISENWTCSYWDCGNMGRPMGPGGGRGQDREEFM